jgi:OOP family OmpA-OmpF porin
MTIRLFGPATLFLLLPSLALAGPPTEAEPEPDEAAASSGDRQDREWIDRWAPERNMLELGIYGGVFFPGRNHELFSPDFDLPNQGYQPLSRVAPDLGARVGYYPLRVFGVEAEGGVMPASLADEDGSALLYTARGHLVAQLAFWSVVPFVVVGAGGLGVSSPRSSLGKDIDPALHWGGGVKFYINRYVMLRLDVRDVVSYKREVENVFVGHNPELLLGLGVTLGRSRDKTPADRDRDCIVDSNDACPSEAETVNDYQDEDGCPESDKDGDGFWDDKDTCPSEAETVNDYQDEDGCPESDQDGDGFWDDKDTCPEQAETVNEFEDDDGCPEQDPDADRFFDEQDTCPQEPESDNGYKDDDGCPDEVPKDVQAFTGAIDGITFETNSDKIRPSSTKTLDKAVKVLTDNPDIRIKLSGHTDNQGERELNIDLSKRRADAVKHYLTDKGIEAGRMETEGHGPDKPIDTNDTKDGRANNRRIEFEIIRRAR